MGYVHLARHIAASPAEVFDRIVDVDRLSWLTLVEDIRAASPRLDQVGAQLCALMKLGPRHLEVDWTVTKVDPDRLLHLDGVAVEGGNAEVAISCAAWDGGTELEFDLEYELPGGFVTNLADRIWVERAIAHDLKQSLKILGQIAG
jgi:hypothetical protein